VANYLDFLVVLDDYIRGRPDGCVRGGYEMHEIARQAGLVEPGHEIAANWAGILVEHGYLSHGPRSMGDRRVEVPGRVWDSTQVQRYADYRLTSSGREEADRLRRQAREQRTDAALGNGFARIAPAWLSESQKGAIAEPIGALRAALDANRHGDAIGAAKDLVEAACKISIERAGVPVSGNQSLPALFKQACSANRDDGSVGEDLGRSLTTTVLRLAELRNAAGAGHGRASVPDRSAREAHLAASAACGVVAFLFGAEFVG
jgi:hypothetical protein